MRCALVALCAARCVVSLVAPSRDVRARCGPLCGRRSEKLVIWDCDGVLVDSEALLKQAEVDALVDAGFEGVTTDDCNRLFSGFAPEAGAANFLEEYGKPLPEGYFEAQIANSLQLFRDKLVTLNGDTVRGLGKPEPDIFLKAAKHCGFEPKDCVVV